MTQPEPDTIQQALDRAAVLLAEAAIHDAATGSSPAQALPAPRRCPGEKPQTGGGREERSLAP